MRTEKCRARAESGVLHDLGLWREVREVAEAVVGSASAPPGYVRRELPVGERQVEVYAGVASGEEEGTRTVVVVLSPAPALPSAEDLCREFGLTDREAEVALLLAARRSNKEIARRLSIAQKTAWRHTAQVLSKLGTCSRREVGRVLRSTLCDDPDRPAPPAAWLAAAS